MPLPSQVPSVPQVAAVASVQELSGSVPAGMLVQVPRVAVSAHEAQVPEQVEAQQTPCWQRPEAQVPAAVQEEALVALSVTYPGVEVASLPKIL